MPPFPPISGAFASRALLAVALVFAGSSAWAANPLNLTPGVTANLTLGSIQNLAAFDRTTGSADISYTNSDLATRIYSVRLPAGFDPNDATKKYGLITYIDAGSGPLPASYTAALDAHDVIWIGGNNINNDIAVNTRRGVAIMGAFRMVELYPIDPARIYASGLSGGGRTACDLAYLRTDFFRGFVGRVGSSIPGTIPGWECAGTNATNADADYEFGLGSSVVLPTYFRTALMTQFGDFRRAENMAIYRWGHLNHGNTARLVMRPGGHSDEIGASFTDALNFLYHPLVDVIWDRFEDAKLGANLQAGKIVAGTGFTTLSGNVAETTYASNSVTHGVLKLTGTAAAARSNDGFAWQSPTGILVDARLRGETATTANQNQQIGLHVVPATASGLPADQPGLHVYWCYGATYRAELVSATGTRKTLATWEHPGTHPMSLAANDKTFYGDTAAPDYAGKTKSFRGEDVRIVLNSLGFQLTLNRFAANATTTTGVTLQSSDSSTPYAENIPMVIQGLWSDIDAPLINALPTGPWRLALTNDALTPGQPCGNAVVDEIRVVASAGPQAAPDLAVTAPANTTRTLTWVRVPGAMGYVLEKSTAPDGPFTSLTTLANTASTYSDTVAENVAFYYRISATGSDGGTGTWSRTGFAARNVAVPATPGGAAVTYPAAYQVRVAWTDNATNETAYRVERSPSGRDQWALVSGSLSANATSYLDTGLAAGASYDYRVSAVGTGGLSAFGTVTATVPDVAPPAPTGLAGNVTFTTANLTWTPVPQASTYRVKRAAVSGGPYTTVAGNLTAAAFTDTGLTPGGTLYYVVSAVGAALESGNSAELALTPPVIPPPGNLTVTPGFTTNSLAWTAAAGVSSYTIRRATAPDGPFTVLAANVPGTAYVDAGLPTGVTYYYTVGSAEGAVESTATAAVSGVPLAGTFTKANNVTALDQPASWSPAGTPTLADTVAWNGTYSSGSVSVGGGLTTGTLRLTAPSTAITITPGTGNLTLGAGGLDLSAATQNLALNAPVALAANQTWNVAASRTVTLAAPVTAAAPAASLTLSGNGTLTYNGTAPAAPIPGPFTATGGTFRVNQPTGDVTLTAANLPAGTNATFTALTGAAGARLTIDAEPTARLAFASNTAGFTLVIKNGNVTYSALTGSTDATNVRVEGGTFTIAPTSARYQVASANQTFQLLGGLVDVSKVTSFGLRIGGTGSATQVGAQAVTANQSGGALLTTFCTIGGNDTTSAKSPAYTLTNGTFTTTSTAGNSLQIGADPAGNGTATFALAGGRLVVPGTLSGAQAGARQVFAFTGGTLAAATVNVTNLRSSAVDPANGTLAQSGGTLAPGDLGVAGRTALTGNYSLGAGAALAIDLGGPTQASAFQTGQYDLLTVSGTTALAGPLRINLLPGYTPANSANFTVLTGTGALSGAFANVTFGQRLATQGGEGTFVVTQVGNTVRLGQFLNALDSWRLANLGSSANAGLAADGADPDGDGVPNLLEYALDTIPTSAASVATPGLQVSGLRPQPLLLQISFLRARADLTYIVEATSDLAAPAAWSTIATNPGSLGQPVTVTDSADLSLTPRRFLRLSVTAP